MSTLPGGLAGGFESVAKKPDDYRSGQFPRWRWYHWFLRLPTLTQRQADLLTAVSNVIFAVALLPTVLAGTILPIASSAATLVALMMLSVVLAHFKLWWGFAWNIVCASMWATLLVMAL